MISDETREKWVAALRSGGYAQATEVLRDNNDGYCCLGVLADLDPEYSWIPGGSQRCYSLLNPEGLTSEGDLEWESDLEHFGLTRDAMSYLVKLNDDYRKSFTEIAHVIENGRPGCPSI